MGNEAASSQPTVTGFPSLGEAVTRGRGRNSPENVTPSGAHNRIDGRPIAAKATRGSRPGWHTLIPFADAAFAGIHQPGGNISDIALLLRALQFAAQKHSGQPRKDVAGSPYINHPIAVAELLARVGGVQDVQVLSAALLHDTVEDTHTSLDELERAFGAEVRGIVAEVTDDKTLPKEERKRLQVEHAAHASLGAKLVKLGDKTCNVLDVLNNPPAGWNRERRVEYVDWAERVVDQCRGTNAALEGEFDEIVQAGRASFNTPGS